MPTENPSQEQACAQCRRQLAVGEGVRTENKLFCPQCYEQLRATLTAMVDAQSKDINYGGALTGGILGGALGALVWWGFTVLTNIAFGLVAVLIGIAVGKGVVMLSGGKRARSLQGMSVLLSIVSFGYASYWVNRTYILRAMVEQGQEVALPFFPDPSLLFEVATLNFGLIDLFFLGIVIWQSWRIPQPIGLR